MGLVTQERGRQLFAEDEMMMTLRWTVVPAVALVAAGVVVVALILWLA